MIVRRVCRALGAVWRALEGHGRYQQERRLGVCSFCFLTVFESDPHIRRGRQVWHAEPCAEMGAVVREHEKNAG